MISHATLAFPLRQVFECNMHPSMGCICWLSLFLEWAVLIKLHLINSWKRTYLTHHDKANLETKNFQYGTETPSLPTHQKYFVTLSHNSTTGHCNFLHAFCLLGVWFYLRIACLFFPWGFPPSFFVLLECNMHHRSGGFGLLPCSDGWLGINRLRLIGNLE